MRPRTLESWPHERRLRCGSSAELAFKHSNTCLIERVDASFAEPLVASLPEDLQWRAELPCRKELARNPDDCDSAWTGQ
jgi:hypothetical protein